MSSTIIGAAAIGFAAFLRMAGVWLLRGHAQWRPSSPFLVGVGFRVGVGVGLGVDLFALTTPTMSVRLCERWEGQR